MSSSPAVPRHADGTPAQLGRYRLLRPISSGGMARVFEGRREGIAGVAPRVAVKVILPEYSADSAFHDLFIHEARVGSLVRHQNLVQIQDFDKEDDRYYLVMEYVEGVTLRRIVGVCRRHGVPVPLGVILEIGRQACEGLHHLHHVRDDAGRRISLVHRDIKPSNLMVDGQGIVKILDLGVARTSSSPDQHGVVRGTWGYMAPEQAVGASVGPAADLFGLAVTLYELAALEPLFPESKPEQVRPLYAADEAARRVLRLKADPDRQALVPLLVRALQRDPAARFRSAADMGRALLALAPDPARSRQELLSFERTISELARPKAADPRAEARPAARPARRPDPGLPVDAARPRRPRPVPVAERRTSYVGYALLGIAALIALLAAWRLTASPATAGEVEASAGSQTRPVGVAAAQVERPAADISVAENPAPPTIQAKVRVASAPPEAAAAPAASAAPPAAAAPAAAPPTPAIDPHTPGALTLSAMQGAQVYLNGTLVRRAPLFQHALPPGTHTITLVADDGRRATFPIEIPPGASVTRVWDFDSARFAGLTGPVAAAGP